MQTLGVCVVTDSKLLPFQIPSTLIQFNFKKTKQSTADVRPTTSVWDF